MRPGMIPPVPLDQARAASKAVAIDVLTAEVTALRAEVERLTTELAMTGGPRPTCSVGGCEKPTKARQNQPLCSMHLARLTKHGDVNHSRGRSIPLTVNDWDAVFLGRFTKSDSECWIWNGYRNDDGYGEVKFKRRLFKAHRLSYELSKGPIADELTVDHLCFERGCVNPGHLRLLTHIDNTQNRRNLSAETCVNGHDRSLHVYVDQRGKRVCRECRRLSNLRLTARRALTVVEPDDDELTASIKRHPAGKGRNK